MRVSMDTFFSQQSKHGIMDDDDQEFDNEDAISSSSSLSNVSSDSSEFMEDATSSSGSSPSSVLKSDHKNSTTTTSGGGRAKGALYEMGSLMQHLPFKRGLSKHYQGKSQSFTSLSDVSCLEDLVKPSKKKLKSCKSYGGGLSEATHNKVSLPKTSSKIISKNKGGSSSRGSWSSLSGAARRPPVAPQRNNSSLFNQNQTPLFA